MGSLRGRAAIVLFSSAAITYAADRLTKTWAERVLQDHPIELIRGALTLTFTTNSGGAFSLGQRAPWFFASVSILVAGLILATAFRHTGSWNALALGLILGGTLGNLTDRVIRGDGLLSGRVVDFIDVHVWPVFNLSDTAIVLGAGLLAWTAWRAGRNPARGPADGS